MLFPGSMLRGCDECELCLEVILVTYSSVLYSSLQQPMLLQVKVTLGNMQGWGPCSV